MLLALFALLTWQVAADGPLRRADERLGRAAPGALPRGFAEFLADLGGVTVAVPVLALAAAYAALRGRGRGMVRWWLPPLGAVLAMAAVPAVIAPLKAVIGRPGPPGAHPGGYFPSGHAATAAVAFGAAAVLLLPFLRTAGARLLVGACVPVLNAGVGAGLVVRGYHWPLDVLGSWLLCALLPVAWGPVGRAVAGRRWAGAGLEGTGRAATESEGTAQAAPGSQEPDAAREPDATSSRDTAP